MGDKRLAPARRGAGELAEPGAPPSVPARFRTRLRTKAGQAAATLTFVISAAVGVVTSFITGQRGWGLVAAVAALVVLVVVGAVLVGIQPKDTGQTTEAAGEIRRAERREAALLALKGKLAELRNEVLHLRAQARQHPEASQGLRALELLRVFEDFWQQGQVSGVIPDTSIREEYAALYGFPVWRSNFGPRPAGSAVGDNEPLRPADVIDLDELWLAVNHMNDTVNIKVSGLLGPGSGDYPAEE